MREERGGMGRGGGRAIFTEMNSMPRSNFYTQLHSDPNIPCTAPIGAGPEEDYTRNSSASTASQGCYSERSTMSGEGSPYNSTSWNQSTPYVRSPWSRSKPAASFFTDDGATLPPGTRLVGSLVREEGHIYSLASSADLLYTGSDSKNIRVWKNQEEFSGFKSNSGLVKAIVIAGERIFTGHQDGKIRVWRVSRRDPTVHKRAGTLPTFKDLLKSSVRPSNYVEVRRHRNSLWIRHNDAVSCLSLSEDGDILYSGSWDKTFKVWRVADSRCLESVRAHDDAVNAILTGFGGLVFTGSADGTVKVWRREPLGKGTKHSPSQTLLKQESAVTALSLNSTAAVLYSGSSDGLINFWERKKHLSHGGVLRGHKQAVLCMASAGSLVMSGSADRTICIWRRDDGAHTCLSVLNGHTGPVKCLAVERDSDSHPADPRWILYSGSLDKSVKVWKVAELPTGDHLSRQKPEEPSSGAPSPAGNHPHGAAAGNGVSGEGASQRFASPLGK